MVTKAKRIDHIDGLRGIAALLVVWLHVTEQFVRRLPVLTANEIPLIHSIAEEANFSRIGVLIFFTVSGFVIPFSFPVKTENRINHTKTFIVKRFFRLYPVFLVFYADGFHSVGEIFFSKRKNVYNCFNKLDKPSTNL